MIRQWIAQKKESIRIERAGEFWDIEGRWWHKLPNGENLILSVFKYADNKYPYAVLHSTPVNRNHTEEEIADTKRMLDYLQLLPEGFVWEGHEHEDHAMTDFHPAKQEMPMS